MQSGHLEKDLGCTELDKSWGPEDGTLQDSDTGHNNGAPHPDPVLVWAPSGRSLLSGLLGLNVMLFGAALVAANAFHPQGLRHQESMVYLLLLMGLSLAWMLWYIFWARRLPGASPHKDHHAGGITVTVILMLFAGFSLLLHVFKMGYYIMMSDCKPITKVIFPFIEAPFLALQTYLIWAHSKDCIHKNKILTRCGLIVLLSADLLLWLNAVTDDTVHEEIELERQQEGSLGNTTLSLRSYPPDTGHINATQCQCRLQSPCLVFRKGIEVLYPFNIEFHLMAGCMIYVMWKNVGRWTDPAATPHHSPHTFRVIFSGGIFLGPLLGLLVLGVGMTIFILYQVWVSQQALRLTAFLLFYGYHLVVLPVMSLCSLAGVLVHRWERRAHDDGHNPTRSLDVMLLVMTALGQLSLSYFSVTAALAKGVGDDILGGLDLSFSLLMLLELVLQNIFIIEGLHTHPSLTMGRAKGGRNVFKRKKPKDEKASTTAPEVETEAPTPPSGEESNNNHQKTKRVIQEICAFLILSNIMLWVIPAFGAHPQFENGLGKEFYGFTAWFVLVNLGQPLGVFYRMHSVGALMELLISA